MLHIGIIWANPYSNNLGVAALAYSSLAILNDVCEENRINADFALVGSRGKSNDEIVIKDGGIKFKNIIGNDHLKWKSVLRLALFPKKYHTRSILNLDIVFDISEGDSFTDIYGKNRHRKFLNSKRFFNFLKTPQILLPQTIGPFTSKLHEKQAFRVMRKMEMVISRDKQSLDYTSKFLEKNKIQESIDVAFYMPFQKMRFDENKIHVGINVSGLLWNGGYTRKNQFKLKCGYNKLVENAINYFAGMENVCLHFISHVISKKKSVEDDYAVAEEFHQKISGSVLAPSFKSPIHAKSYISGLDFFFGSRMHACIAAFSSGVPVFPIAYSRKFNGLFSETLGYKWLGDCVNEDEDQIFAELVNSFHNRTKIKAEIDFVNQGFVKERLEKLKGQLLKSIRTVEINQ